ncbi:MAG TPA: MFS transporter [Acidimicrobiales bacterium]|nr:MFS transporter [Acidimicrobiales bacterium]
MANQLSEPARRRMPGRWRGSPSTALAAILTAQMMVVLDATVVNVALPHIQTSLKFSGSSLSWVLNAYVLTFGGLLLLGARSGDLLGRRRTFLIGIGLFTVSSLVGGLATTAWMLLAARAAQGVGGALAAPTALALLTTLFPEGPGRVRAIGLFTTVSAAGGAAGLFVGGLLTEWASWRWVMFINVPIGLAVVAAGWAVLGETSRGEGRFDLAGALTSTGGMSAIVLGLVDAGSSGWTAASTLFPLAMGLALMAVFVRVELTVAQPILPMRLLASRVRTGANAARGLGYAGMYGMIFFLTQYFQEVQGRSALVTGLAFLPAPVTVFLSSQLTSRVLIRRLREKTVMLLGSALLAAGLLVMTQLHGDTSYLQILPGLVLLGAGMGTSFVSLTTAALADVDPADAGAASGLINVMQQVGAALGLAVLVTVFDSLAGPEGSAGLASATGAARSSLVHSMDLTVAVGLLFALAAFTIVAIAVRPASRESYPSPGTVPTGIEASLEAA